jgi:hypothetical protein
MFCPVCKSEYRDGFTKCSDCDVDLVGQLADDSEAKEPLWAGQDASVRDAICERLDAAKILHEDDSVESQFMPAFRQSIYRIEIRKKDHDAALNAVRDIYLDQPSARPSPGLVLDRNSELLNTARAKRGIWGRMIVDGSEECEPSSAPKIPTNAPASGNRDESAEDLPDDQLESFSPNEATSQVWSGPEREMAQNIDVCLREVGIGCVVNESSGNFNVCVERASEIRAKEIIREIIEQTPPE